MKLWTILLFLSFFSMPSFAQQSETHDGKIMGSIPIGNKEVTTIYDETTLCERKTNPHAIGLFTSGEAVQIKFENGKEMAEVLKTGLSEQVFANKNCKPAAKRKGPTQVSLSCDGTCSCSLQGVLSGEESYVECSCEECTMEITFSGAEAGGSGSSSDYTLENQATMVVPFLEDFLAFAEDLTEYTLTGIEIYRNGTVKAVQFRYTDENGIDQSTMFSKTGGKKFQITCDGECGCREVYSFESNIASCSCDDCVMTVEEVSAN